MLESMDLIKYLTGAAVTACGFMLYIYRSGVKVGVEQESSQRLIATLGDVRTDVRAILRDIVSIHAFVAVTTASIEEHRRRLEVLERHTYGLAVKEKEKTP